LDIGCGTGEDALHFGRLGADVVATDASPAMVRIANGRGVNARVLRIENIGDLGGTYNLVLSNFGALNCIGDLRTLRGPLAGLVRAQGYLALCLMSRFCLWESWHYAVRGQFRKASRRWRGESTASGGLRVFYPSAREVQNALIPGVTLVADVGIGISIPPSFAGALSAPLLHRLEWVDARFGASKFGRTMGDHRLFVFRRS
jgi:SAM-dependent methyltransferase